jgi:hypothetical protein
LDKPIKTYFDFDSFILQTKTMLNSENGVPATKQKRYSTAAYADKNRWLFPNL